MDDLTEALVALGLLGAVGLTCLIVVVVLLMRTVRRARAAVRAATDRAAHRLRDAADGAQLTVRARSLALPGARSGGLSVGSSGRSSGAHAPHAEVALLRAELRTSLADLRRTLRRAQSAGWCLGDAPALTRRIETAATTVDAELKTAGLERDGGQLLGVLPQLRQRAATVCESAGQLRRGLLASSLRTGTDELDALHADCATEAQALRAQAHPHTHQAA